MQKRLSAGQIVTQQIDLWERLTGETHFVDWLWPSREKNPDIWPVVRKAIRDAAGKAECYRISDDMSTLVQASAAQLDESDVWNPELAPARSGLVHFNEPLLLSNPDGVSKAHWILWGPVGANSTMFIFFNDLLEPDDLYGPILAKTDRSNLDVTGRWAPISYGTVPAGQSMDPSTFPRTAEEVAEALSQGTPLTQHTNAVMFLHALWLLMEQRFSEVQAEPVRGTSPKRAKRRGIWPKVSIVQLRRKGEGARQPGESKVEWTRRWAVRGHWRWQPFGPGRHSVRRIYIGMHVKGPEDKPLVVSKKVYDVKR